MRALPLVLALLAAACADAPPDPGPAASSLPADSLEPVEPSADSTLAPGAELQPPAELAPQGTLEP